MNGIVVCGIRIVSIQAGTAIVRQYKVRTSKLTNILQRVIPTYIGKLVSVEVVAVQ